MSDGWLYVEHEETGGKSRIPDDDAVRVWNEARGWRVVDPPDDSVFVPARPPESDGEAPPAFVELVHPEIDARHDFPNNPDALRGAYEAGWVEPNKDGSIPKPATAKRRAKAAEEAAPHSGGDSAAGESTDGPADSSATTDEEELNRG